MDVGDLVTLSSAGRKIDRIITEHKRFFRGPDSNYYGLCSEDKKRFNNYWDGSVVGLITKIYREPINRYDYEAGAYVQDREKVTYYVAWQANPKGMVALRQTRGHLKFVKRGKKK